MRSKMDLRDSGQVEIAIRTRLPVVIFCDVREFDVRTPAKSCELRKE